ncbi:LOW QUALITY PROTEIN: UDP-glycosyltransferase UGT5-like [Homalodisca vitripennis]|uniref:LOW QUALITY PROTEIN: UDP-glycosyltransferase UGT5-like n=1 Tax=Homalodisca vitripennis TaxID=197043 RepID=UPI001EEAF764|nr:LOW QUALITY PROTEIN: UDP-glycosyltransferase UGT5-like [Homalodisca vitripennis]
MYSFLVFGCFLGSALSANILAVFPHPGKSHFDVFEPLVLELAARGHQMTVMSFYPQKPPVANYTDISLVGTSPLRLNRVKIGGGDDTVPDTFSVSNVGLHLCSKIFKSKPVLDLLESDARFDLIILEMFDSDCFLGLVHKYKVPHIGFNSAKTSPDQDRTVGTPNYPAYVSHINLPFTNRMGLFHRVINVAYTLMLAVERFFVLLWEQRGFYQLMGEGVPPLEQLVHNASLILVNTHFSLLGSRPLVPAHIEVGGIHIKPVKPLSKDLNNFLNESPEGAIIFSMGSVLKSSSFPVNKRQAIMEAFAELPVRVVMKWENESLPGKPDNVMISNWLPQRDVLAHPKIRAFMGHGGLLSTGEAITSGVPMVLIPMFGDQGNNVAHLTSLGAAVKLDYDYISKETVLEALRAVLFDSSYREKAKDLSERFTDRPMSPLDTAVYWTEYVLRHKGARHLRSPAVDMPWYQLWLLDVAVVLLVCLAGLLLVMYWLARRYNLKIPHFLQLGSSRKKIQ